MTDGTDPSDTDHDNTDLGPNSTVGQNAPNGVWTSATDQATDDLVSECDQGYSKVSGDSETCSDVGEVEYEPWTPVRQRLLHPNERDKERGPTLDDRLDWCLEKYVTGTPKRQLRKLVAEEFGVADRTARKDVQLLFTRRIPELYGRQSIDSRINEAVAGAEATLREAWDEMRALQSGAYDYDTPTGTRRPPSSPYLAQIIAAQRHLAEMTGASANRQVWAEKKVIEEMKAGTLARAMDQVSQMSDEQLLAEAARLAKESGEDV